mmetsp:Transcript_28240/g.51458  ORF Transcript_28240/g.51458 Transcript_28240/m.51458 type:complete len:348 (-) Transcript_28240:602-1645(-)
MNTSFTIMSKPSSLILLLAGCFLASASCEASSLRSGHKLKSRTLTNTELSKYEQDVNKLLEDEHDRFSELRDQINVCQASWMQKYNQVNSNYAQCHADNCVTVFGTELVSLNEDYSGCADAAQAIFDAHLIRLAREHESIRNQLGEEVREASTSSEAELRAGFEAILVQEDEAQDAIGKIRLGLASLNFQDIVCDIDGLGDEPLSDHDHDQMNEFFKLSVNTAFRQADIDSRVFDASLEMDVAGTGRRLRRRRIYSRLNNYSCSRCSRKRINSDVVNPHHRSLNIMKSSGVEMNGTPVGNSGGVESEQLDAKFFDFVNERFTTFITSELSHMIEDQIEFDIQCRLQA